MICQSSWCPLNSKRDKLFVIRAPYFVARALFSRKRYGVATISRMLKNIGLFCKRDLQKRPIFCKETYIFKHPTHRSHPIHTFFDVGLATLNNRTIRAYDMSVQLVSAQSSKSSLS